MGIGEVRFEVERGAVLGDRLFQLPLVAQGDGKVAVELGTVGLEAERGAILGDRLVQLPALRRALPR